ncbi:MAG: HDOD domain-containing protein [Casimicrobiaceae bacterium]
MLIPVEAINDASFRFLQDIAKDLAEREVSFPTFAAATVQVRAALDDPNVNADKLATVISREPLLAAKLVRLANSAAVNAGGKIVADVRTAVVRVGHATVRSVAVAVAFEQLRADRELQQYRPRLEAAWRHSVQVASLSYVIARKLTRIAPDEALFAGLVHDVGYFYLLSVAPRYPELQGHDPLLDGILRDWHPSIGQAVLHAFSLPTTVMEAVGEHETAVPRMPPRTVADVVRLANLAADETNPVRDPEVAPVELDMPQLADLIAQSREQLGSLVSALHP